MYRKATERDSPKQSNEKSYANYSIKQSPHNEQVSSYHISQYISQDKSPKKGITTSVSFTTQNPIPQNYQEQFPFSIKQQQSVYEQYLKSLESEINSRERERIQLQKGLDQVQREYKIVWDQLSQQKRKSNELRAKFQILQNRLKQTESHKRTNMNQKQTIVKQYQYELQKNKILQGNEMKLRSSYETLKKTYDSLVSQHQKTKLQHQHKSTAFQQTINKLHQQITTLRCQSVLLQERIRAFQQINKQLKDQLDETMTQKNRMTQSITREKGFVEKQYHKQQKEHLEIKLIATQRQEMIKQLSKRVNELQQLHQLQKDKLNYRISELTFENSTLVKENQSVKSQLKKQLQITINENTQLRMALGQFEKEKKVDLVHNEQLHKGLDRLQKEINGLVESKLNGEKEKQSLRLKYEQEMQKWNDKYEKLQIMYGEKCGMYEQVRKELQVIGKESQVYKLQSVTKIKQLTNELTVLIEQKSQQFSSQSQVIQRLKRQKEGFEQQLKKRTYEYQKQLKQQYVQLTKQSQLNLNEQKKQFQNKVQKLHRQILQSNDQVSKLRNQLLSSNQQHINQVNRLSIKYEQRLSQMSLLQEGNSLQLEQHHNQQVNHLNTIIKQLNQQITLNQSNIFELQTSLIDNTKNYQELQRVTQTQIQRLNQQLVQKTQLIQELQEHISQQKNLYQEEKSKLTSQIVKLTHQLKQITETIIQLYESTHSINQFNFNSTNSNNTQTTPSLPPLTILSSIKHLLNNLKQQNISLHAQLHSNQQINSQLLTQKHHTSELLQDRINELRIKLQQSTTKQQQLQSIINQVISQIASVVEYAEKYSGQNISKVSQHNIKSLLTVDSHAGYGDINTPHISNNNEIVETTRMYCQSLCTFIGQRLYVISIFMQENTQLKHEIQTKITQNKHLSQKLTQQSNKYQQLLNQHTLTLKEKQSLKQQLQSTNNQKTQSITSLKAHITSYKGQLTNYQQQIKEISLKFQQHQRQQIQSSKHISLLEQQNKHYQVELQIKHKQFENQCKEILKLNTQLQIKNQQLQKINKQLNLTKQDIQKLTHQHILELQTLKMTHFHQLTQIQQSSTNQKKSLKHQSQSILNKLHQQSIILQQKIKHLEKLLQTKTLQYSQLQTHYHQKTKTQQSTYQTQITSLQNQIKYLQNKSHSPSKQIMRNKISHLQNYTEQLQKQLKILSENNTLLRKNYISALQEKQALREQVKLNKSQRSSDSRTHSKDPARNTSQQFKNKYLLKKNTQRRNSNQTQSSLSQSLGPRCYSNSNLNNSQGKRFQSPRDSSTKMSSHNLTQPKDINIQHHAQTERPVSNIQKLTPHIPLDLKRIRQRNQKYFGAQDTNDIKKQVPSNMGKKADIKIEILNEDQLPSLVSPVKYLDQPDHSY